MSKPEIIDKYAARLLMVSFFFPMISQVQVIGAVSIYFVCRTFIAKQHVPRSNYFWALVIGSSYLLYLFSIPITQQEYRPFLEILCQRTVSLLFMPIVFAIITPSFKDLLKREMIYFVYACLISSTAGNADYMYHYLAGKTVLPFLSHVEYRMFFEAVTLIHPTYMGMYLCFSICILLFSGSLNYQISKALKYTLIYLSVIYVLSLLAKAPLIALVVIFCHFLYMHRNTLYRYKALFAGMIAAMAGVYFFVPFFRQRMREMYSLFNPDKAGTAQYNSVDVRKLIWNIDTEMIRKHWLTGVSPARMLHQLHEHYFFYSIANQFDVGYYDPHNEYFSMWLSFGILGIILFLCILAIHFIKAVRAKDHLYLYLLLILYITFFTETVLSRQRGVVFYAIFTSFFFFCSPMSGKHKSPGKL